MKWYAINKEYVRNKGNSEPNQVYNSIEDDFDDYDK